MNARRPIASAVLIATLAAFAPPTRAEDKAAAVELFNAAKKDMDAGKFADACPKLEAARKHDPSADGVVLRLAACYQGLGRWATSWGLFKESAARAEKAGRKDRLDLAKKGIADVEKHLSYLTVTAKAEVRVPGLEVKLDGEPVDEATFGIALPINPGEHTLSVSATGRKAWQTTITVANTAEKKAVELPKLEDATPAAAAKVPTTAPSASEPSAPSGDTASREAPPPSGTPTLAYVAIGAGALFIGGAVVSRIKMGSELDDYRAGCAQQLSYSCDDSDGRGRVRTWETLSWISGGVGLAAIGVGVTLLVTAPKGERKAAVAASPATLAGGPALLVTGSF